MGYVASSGGTNYQQNRLNFKNGGYFAVDIGSEAKSSGTVSDVSSITDDLNSRSTVKDVRVPRRVQPEQVETVEGSQFRLSTYHFIEACRNGRCTR